MGDSATVSEEKDHQQQITIDSGVGNGGDEIRYIPDFVSETEERQLLEHVHSAPKPKWRQLSNRRLQNWGGLVSGNQCLLQDEQLPKWLDQCIDKIMAAPVPGGTTFPAERRPNHVLVNEYLPGQGIMPHTDGPTFYPLIATISLGSHTLLDFYEELQQKQGNHDDDLVKGEEEENDEEQRRQEKEQPENRRLVGSVLLEPRSLVLVQGKAYQWLHGIAERHSDNPWDANLLNRSQLGRPVLAGTVPMSRGIRISLTIRNVPRVKRLALAPFRSFAGVAK